MPTLSAHFGCPIATSAPSSDFITQAHDGATDTGKTLATAGARPKSDPRDLEKTLNAPHSDHLEFAYHYHTNPEPGLRARLSGSCAVA